MMINMLIWPQAVAQNGHNQWRYIRITKAEVGSTFCSGE